jgi:DNA-binding transcriptional regulator YiaG
MGVCTESVSAWEAGKVPSDRLWPKVLAFLGYDPSPAPQTAAERLTAARRAQGLSMRALARSIGCDEGTVEKWERGVRMPGRRHRSSAALLFGHDPWAGESRS